MLIFIIYLGWRPRRTIIFCSWDGEEYGIIGSIEWLDVSIDTVTVLKDLRHVE